MKIKNDIVMDNGLNYSKILFISIGGYVGWIINELIYDVSKSLGNFIYKVTPDLGMFQLAQSMYNDGEIEIPDELKGQLIVIISHPQCPFIAIIKQKIIEILNEQGSLI